MNTTPQTPLERFDMIFALLQRILREVEDLKGEVDSIDRSLRPYGDGSRVAGRRR